ncbi:SMI1/KNR4 family protein [Rhizobacter sp. LjRoot28]|uniref:SMI1/KNR4 family protein n=1 Tax=Rhizobacter sp. LjRoot28 TaxID=3342309 RepID=UPI003ED14743
MPFNLDESFLLAAELAIEARLPESYRGAMLRKNGGEVEACGDDWEQYPIADTSDRKRLARTANHVLLETARLRTWPRFPVDALAIAGNGAGDQLVLIREGEAFRQEVFLWRHESGALEIAAADFSDLR